MRLFDRLILADGVAKVVDVGHLSFPRFFSVMDEIGFAEEAQRRALEVIVLYAADAASHVGEGLCHPAAAVSRR